MIIAKWRFVADGKTYTMHDASKVNTENVFHLIDELGSPYECIVKLIEIEDSFINELDFQDYLEWHFRESSIKTYKFKELSNYKN